MNRVLLENTCSCLAGEEIRCLLCKVGFHVFKNQLNPVHIFTPYLSFILIFYTKMGLRCPAEKPLHSFCCLSNHISNVYRRSFSMCTAAVACQAPSEDGDVDGYSCSSLSVSLCANWQLYLLLYRNPNNAIHSNGLLYWGKVRRDSLVGCVYWSVGLCIDLSVCVLICRLVYWPVGLCIDLSAFVLICRFVYWSVGLCIDLSACVLICRFPQTAE